MNTREPFFTCYLEVLKDALTMIRSLSYEKQSEQAADLADAVCNIPEVIQSWEKYEGNWLMNYFKEYDEKWAKSASDFSLVKHFEKKFDELKLDRNKITKLEKNLRD